MQLPRIPVISALLLGGLAYANVPGRVQQYGNVRSLGEVARQLKADREKEKQKPVAVYTNDNLPSQGSLGIGNHKEKKRPKGKSTSAGTKASIAGPAEKHNEKYFRAKADKIRAQMDFHRRQLAVLQQQLGLGKMQYYPNPQKTLDQESTPAFQSDVNKLSSKIAEVQKKIAHDQKAMDDLQEELRHEGGDPSWVR